MTQLIGVRKTITTARRALQTDSHSRRSRPRTVSSRVGGGADLSRVNALRSRGWIATRRTGAARFDPFARPDLPMRVTQFAARRWSLVVVLGSMLSSFGTSAVDSAEPRSDLGLVPLVQLSEDTRERLDRARV